MKITTWNVNGIRASLKKGLYEWVQAHQPDVLCLQEIKARPEQLPEESREPEAYEFDLESGPATGLQRRGDVFTRGAKRIRPRHGRARV